MLCSSRRRLLRPLITVAIVALLATNCAASAQATVKVVHSFTGLNWRLTGEPDAAQPDGPLLAANGGLYGASAVGGQHALGAIYELKPPRYGAIEWSHSLIYSFSGSDGAGPSGHLLYWHNALYGTTSSNSAPVAGTVYRLTPGPTGWTHEILYTFPQYPQNEGTPQDGVIAVGDSLYGTNDGAGNLFFGSVFKLSPPIGGHGLWRESTLHAFTGGADGSEPNSGLVYLNGALFGTAEAGGAYNSGVVFQLIEKHGRVDMTTLYSFQGQGDGAQPTALINVNGMLYGVASSGGSDNAGVVFYEMPVQNGWAFGVVHTFLGQQDGARPTGSLTAIGGSLYGTTAMEGAPDQGPGQGFGTIFAISNFSEVPLYAFKGGNDGANPAGGLLPVAGKLFGVASSAGKYMGGTVFSLEP